MAISLTYFPTREEHCTSNNFEDGARKRTVHKNKQKPKDGAPRPARASPKCLIFPPTDEHASKSIENQSFSTPRNRHRGAAHPRKRIPFNGFGGRPFAPRSRRGEKRAPLREAWEGCRLRAWPNTQNHCKVLRSRTRKSHHLPRIFTTRTPFSPTRMPKRGKGCHFARATERHRAETPTSRQTPPRPPPPWMPHFH